MKGLSARLPVNCGPHAATGVTFLRAYWITMRPYLFFVSGVSGLVGLAMSRPMPLSNLLAALAVFLLAYGFGQALTDVSQIDTDSLSAPYRPLVLGEISRRQVAAVSLFGLTICGATLWVLAPATLALSFAGALGLVAYTSLKRRWWGGPPWNAAIVALLPVMGFLCAREPLSTTSALRLLPWGVSSVFFSYGVFVILGYFKDIEADRAAGYETLPVKVGRRTSVMVSAIWLAAALGSSAMLVVRAAEARSGVGPDRLLALVAWCAGAALLALAHGQMLRTTNDEQAHPAIARSVRGFVWLHCGEVAWLRAEFAPLGLLFAVLFEAALRRRPCEQQI